MSNFSDELIGSFDPLTREDTSGLIAAYLRSVSAMFEEVDDLARDGDTVGWATLMSPSGIPVKGLKYLAQFVGVVLEPSIAPSVARGRITDQAGFRRGSPVAMIAAAQATLTGTKYVKLFERDTSAYHITVVTWTTETPNEPATLAALMGQKPAGIILELDVRTPSRTFIEVDDDNADFDAAEAAYTDFDEMLDL